MTDFLKQGGTVACVTSDAKSKLEPMNYCDDICNKVGLGHCIVITEDEIWDEKMWLDSFKSDTKLIYLSAIQYEFDQNIPRNTTKHITTALRYMKEIGLSVLIPMSSEAWRRNKFELTRNSSLKENSVSDHQFEGEIIKIHYFKLS